MSAIAENSAPATKAPATEGAAAVPTAKRPAEEGSWFGCCGGERKVCISFCFFIIWCALDHYYAAEVCVLCGVALLQLSQCVFVLICVLFAFFLRYVLTVFGDGGPFFFLSLLRYHFSCVFFFFPFF